MLLFGYSLKDSLSACSLLEVGVSTLSIQDDTYTIVSFSGVVSRWPILVRELPRNGHEVNGTKSEY